MDSLYFPPGKSANVLRGAFGTILREVAGEALYARIFEPAAVNGPSGLKDSPRAFVLRSVHLDGCRFAAGAEFHFGLPLFDLREETLDAVRRTFARLADEGIGPGRGRAELIGVAGDAPLDLSLDPVAEPVPRVKVHFVSPTELKTEGGLAERPEFRILAARLRDRISALCSLYGDGAIEMDFRAFGSRAAQVRMIRCDVHHASVKRRSSRTGRTHPLGGFTGEAEYQGDLGEFVPYLEAARWTGVGRQTVWGKGELSVCVDTMVGENAATL